MERLSAEGKFFHRSCFKCEYCATTLRLSSYAYDLVDGKLNLHFIFQGLKTASNSALEKQLQGVQIYGASNLEVQV